MSSCADIYSTAPHVGRGGWTWYTGSAGWLQRAGVESMLGLRIRGAFLSSIPAFPGLGTSTRPRLNIEPRDTRFTSRTQAGSAAASPSQKQTESRSRNVRCSWRSWMMAVGTRSTCGLVENWARSRSGDLEGGRMSRFPPEGARPFGAPARPGYTSKVSGRLFDRAWDSSAIAYGPSPAPSVWSPHREIDDCAAHAGAPSPRRGLLLV